MKKILFSLFAAVAASISGQAQTISVTVHGPGGVCTFTATTLSTGFSNPASITSSGPASSKPAEAAVTISKYADQCSSSLIKDLISGAHVTTVAATLTAPVNGVQTATMTLTYSNVLITQLSDDESAVSAKTGLPLEKVTLMYATVTIADLTDKTTTTCSLTTNTCS